MISDKNDWTLFIENFFIVASLPKSLHRLHGSLRCLYSLCRHRIVAEKCLLREKAVLHRFVRTCLHLHFAQEMIEEGVFFSEEGFDMWSPHSSLSFDISSLHSIRPSNSSATFSHRHVLFLGMKTPGAPLRSTYDTPVPHSRIPDIDLRDEIEQTNTARKWQFLC